MIGIKILNVSNVEISVQHCLLLILELSQKPESKFSSVYHIMSIASRNL
jgi:hypothetical protein